ncbi:MAG: protein kinase domain-containing protein [Solirubrobacteraceae bacterium]
MSSPQAGIGIVGTALSGRYRIDAEIGRGGMSTVYRAFDTVLERPVAIKLLHRDVSTDSGHLERFRREARAVAQLSHPHIVTVIDFGEERAPRARDGADPYIVFEYVDGETLKALIRRQGRLETTDALAYALEIARALAAAHERMIVHRDVKPQNVLLDQEGTAKITDFGIARTLTEQGITMDGRVLGTTDYVSPEQALGQAVTVQSDVYSLGVVLYEMLIGAVPFRGDTPVVVAMRHVREQVPDVQALRPELSAATAAVVDRATEKDLAERYADMHAMIADLEEALAIEVARAGHAGGEATSVLRTLPAPARRRLPWRLRHPLRWIAGIALVVAIVAIVLALAAGNAERGTGVASDVHAQRGLTPVSLAQEAATDYNPYGTNEENPEEIANVVDGDPSTSWTTEQYLEDALNKPGTGFYVDAAPGVLAREVEVQTSTPGFSLAVYGSNRVARWSFGTAKTLSQLGWTQLAGSVPVGAKQTIALRPTDRSYSYYLFWITKLPSESGSASISEVTLFK